MVVVLGGLQSAFTLYLTKKGEISIKRYPVVFRVLKNPKHVACFPPLFFFLLIGVKKISVAF